MFSFQLCYELTESHLANKYILVVGFRGAKCCARHQGYTEEHYNKDKSLLSWGTQSWENRGQVNEDKSLDQHLQQ